jgi:hypothetical protein
MVSLHDGKSRPQPVKLHLTNDALILLKEELVPITEEPVNEIKRAVSNYSTVQDSYLYNTLDL